MSELESLREEVAKLRERVAVLEGRQFFQTPGTTPVPYSPYIPPQWVPYQPWRLGEVWC